MFRASETNLFPGGSVRVGRTEAGSNVSPRRMVVERILLARCGDRTRLTGQLTPSQVSNGAGFQNDGT